MYMHIHLHDGYYAFGFSLMLQMRESKSSSGMLFAWTGGIANPQALCSCLCLQACLRATNDYPLVLTPWQGGRQGGRRSSRRGGALGGGGDGRCAGGDGRDRDADSIRGCASLGCSRRGGCRACGA